MCAHQAAAGIFWEPVNRSALALWILLPGCHLASGLDDFRVDRSEVVVMPETFDCTPESDDFETFRDDLWEEQLDATADRGPGVIEDMEGGMALSLTDANAGDRGGIVTIDKINFRRCGVTMGITPLSGTDTITRLAVFQEPSLEGTPLLEIRREASQVVAYSNGTERNRTPFDGNQLFWRMYDDGSQIQFETSAMDVGFDMFAATKTPTGLDAVHIGLFVQARNDGVSDAITFVSYELAPE